MIFPLGNVACFVIFKNFRIIIDGLKKMWTVCQKCSKEQTQSVESIKNIKMIKYDNYSIATGARLG